MFMFSPWPYSQQILQNGAKEIDEKPSEGNDENDGTKEIDEGHENDAANEIDEGHENDEDEEAGEKDHGVDTEQGWVTFF